jgi:hypothetical protein
MEKEIVEFAKENLKHETTKELLKIWVKNNRDEYSEESFEAIKQILLSRGVEVPNQNVKDKMIDKEKKKIKSKSVRKSTKSCNYCSKEIDKNAVKCPFCGEWVPEIKEIRNKTYISYGSMIFLGVVFILRVNMGRYFELREVFEDPINIILIIGFIIVIIVSTIYEKELKNKKERASR